jgi:hypothetical protein
MICFLTISLPQKSLSLEGKLFLLLIAAILEGGAKKDPDPDPDPKLESHFTYEPHLNCTEEGWFEHRVGKHGLSRTSSRSEEDRFLLRPFFLTRILVSFIEDRSLDGCLLI